MNRLRRPAESQDAGLTLVELLVAMMLTSLVLAMAGTFYVNVARATASAKATRAAMGQTALAVDAVRRIVMTASDNATSATATAPAVSTATPTTLTVISYSSTTSAVLTPSQVTFALDASGYLTETKQAGVIAATGYWVFTGVTTSRRVAGPFVTGAGTPFFSYVDANGALLVSSPGLATADLPKVAFVRVTAKVANTNMSGASDPVVTTTSIGLTNVYRDVGAGVQLPGLSGGQ